MSLLKEGLPEECHIACVCASSKFEEISNRLEKGNVNLKELRKMKERECQVRRLCEVVVASSQKRVLASLDQRLMEFSLFSSRRHAYLDICKWIIDSSVSTESISGMLSYMYVIHACCIHAL